MSERAEPVERSSKRLLKLASHVLQLLQFKPTEHELWSGTPYLSVLEDARRHAQETKASREQLKAIARQASDQAKEAYENHRPRTCLLLLYRSLAFSTLTEDLEASASTLGNLAVQFTNLADYRRGLRLQEEALARKRALGPDTPGIARSLRLIGEVHAYLGNLETAREFMYQSIVALSSDSGRAREEAEGWISWLDSQIALVATISQIFTDPPAAGDPREYLAEAARFESSGNGEDAARAHARSVALAHRSGDTPRELEARLDLARVLFQTARLFREAQIQFEEAASIAQQLQDEEAMACALDGLVMTAMELGQFDAARASIEWILPSLDREELSLRFFEAQAQMFLTYFALGNEDEGQEYAAAMIAAVRRMPPVEALFEAVVKQAVVFSTQDITGQAILLLHAGLELAEQNSVASDAVAALVDRLGDLYFVIRRRADALACYERGLQLAERAGDARAIAWAWISLGHARARVDDYSGALVARRRAERYLAGFEDPELISRAQDLEAMTIASELVEPEVEGLAGSSIRPEIPGSAPYQERIEALQMRIGRLQAENNAEELALSHRNLANLLAQAGAREEAQAHLDLALQTATRSGGLDLIGSILHDQGVLLARGWQLEAARECLILGLRCIGHRGTEESRWTCLVSLAHVELMLGNRTEAEALLSEIEQGTARGGAVNPGRLVILSQVFYRLGRVDEALGTSDAARSQLRAKGDLESFMWALLWATHLFLSQNDIEEAERNGREAAELVIAWERDILNRYRPFYRGLAVQSVDNFLRVYDAAGPDLAMDALQFVERIKARTLITSQSEDALAPPPGMSESLKEEETRLRELRHVGRAMVDVADTKMSAYAASKMVKLHDHQLNQFWASLPDEWHEYSELRQGKTPDPRLLVNKKLGQDSVHILYFYQSQHRLYVWSLDNSGAIADALSVPISYDRSDEIARVTREAIARRQELPDEWIEFSSLLESTLVKFPVDETLCIIPSGPLMQMPFSALRFDRKYLVERNPTAVLPSLSMLAYWGEHPWSGNREAALVIGDSLGDLAGARKETKRIARRLNVKPLIGREVIRKSVSDRLRSCSILHIACHALHDPELPAKSGFRLADDSVFTAQDAAAARMRARLAVLSGCESGREAIYLGDDAVGFTTSLLLAGVESIVAALWRVPDEQTTELMEQFYLEILERQADLASALREAQRKLLKRPATSHPYFWAAYYTSGRWINDFASGDKRT
jgi:tetratricopeptide (TPR) repeat protein